MTSRRRSDHEASGAAAHPLRTGELRWVRRNVAVLGGTLTLLAIGLGFLIHTPTLIGPDETLHFDRVVATAHGDLGLTPGDLKKSDAVRAGTEEYLKTSMLAGGPSWAEFDSTPRDLRPSLADFGPDLRPEAGFTNYMTQHPPLYYGVMGVLMWLMPNADGIPVDQLVFWLRLFNVLMVLPLPWLFRRTAREILDGLPDLGPIRTAALNAAPFAPVLLPGLARFAATINNDNLGNLFGAAIIYGSIRVLRGDTGRRTATLLAVLAVLASLTKLTALVVAAAIPIAYLLRWYLDRRRPRPAVVGILLAGAAGSMLWALRNTIYYGGAIPSDLAWGSRRQNAEGVLRTSEQPFRLEVFWDRVGPNILSRFWGSLGLQAPPRLPTLLLVLLTSALILSVVICLVRLRGRRLAILLPWLLGLGVLLVVIGRSLVHFISYTALAGVQGRYVYPAAIGLLLPMAIAPAIWLGRARAWAPVVVAGAGLLVGGWALFLSFEYTWLHRGDHLGPSTLDFALRTFARHFAFSTAPTVIFAAVAALAALAGLACAIALAVIDHRGPQQQIAGRHSDPGPVAGPAADPSELQQEQHVVPDDAATAVITTRQKT